MHRTHFFYNNYNTKVTCLNAIRGYKHITLKLSKSQALNCIVGNTQQHYDGQRGRKVP